MIKGLKYSQIDSLEKQYLPLTIVYIVIAIFCLNAITNGISYILQGDLSENVMRGDMTLTQKVLGMTLIPVIEEFIFRYCLSFKRSNIILSLALFISYLIVIIGSSNFEINLLIKLLLLVSLSILLFILFDKLIPLDVTFNKEYIFKASLIIFAFMHLNNLSDNQLRFTFIPYIISYLSSIFMLGYLLSFIRIKYSMKYSILSHMIINFIGISMI
ncbi:hypothetical protein [Flammeovirga sp. OC4]|uniref:hypothetical protein n=1 Tax=Flammeovirga sp. OC4 TaxID=1382345 RepID=UPI0005C73F6C|nr:hypothetical protein [Flammeovirga sp. OC4]